jgi:hypothetical protein
MESSDSAHPYAGAKASKFRHKPESNRRAKRHRAEESKDDLEPHRSKKRPSSDEHDEKDRKRSKDDRPKRKHRYRSTGRTIHDHTFSRNGEYDNPDHRQRESLYDDVDEAWYAAEADDPNANEAFRESLFDAMADDEGAVYWESVYGQPIHLYPKTKTGPDGRLEQMSDEEYAQYVRGKMWEKSHQHIMEERDAYEKERKRDKERKKAQKEQRAGFDAEEQEREEIRRRVRDTLKKGEQRKKAAEIANAWDHYIKKWEALQNHFASAKEAKPNVRQLIPWPVASGEWKDVSKEEVDHFFENSIAQKDSPSTLLKVERVRWHPDKMQQRFGQHIDAETIKSVTAVFQVVDDLWSKYRN